MNFIDKLRIRLNPNLIDSFDVSKIDNVMVNYAITQGYQFKPEYVGKYIGESNFCQSYFDAFKSNEEVFEVAKNIVKTSDKLNILDFYRAYKDKFVDVVKSDNDLSKLAVQDLSNLKNAGLDTNGFISIIDQKEELVDRVIQENKLTNEKFREYVASVRSPQELAEKGVNLSDYVDAYISTANPQKYMEVITNSNQEVPLNTEAFREKMGENIGKFLPYYDELNKNYKEKFGIDLVDSNMKKNIQQYLKDNKILYNQRFPEFVLEDSDYVMQCVLQKPKILVDMGDKVKLDLSGHEKEASLLAQKIASEKIKFEGTLPLEYLKDSSILESIISVNPQLLENAENAIHFESFMKSMNDEQSLEYFKNLGVKFTSKLYKFDNFLVQLECIKNDYEGFANKDIELSQEQCKLVYDALKANLTPEEILSNNFLRTNPYFAKDLLESDLNLDNIDFSKTKYYKEFYPDLKGTAMKHGVEIASPEDYEGVIKFDENNNVYVTLDSIENIREGIEYINKHGLNKDLIVNLRGIGDNQDELKICDNLEFFEELAKNNVNLDFRYDSSNTFSLSKVIEDEHFMQSIADDIKSKDFSPLEQLVAVYDIAKSFKPYKEGDRGTSSSVSRSLYEYLNNNYMVCVGYSNLIANIGHRLGAQYCQIGISPNKDNRLGEGHQRNYVNIVDDKYGVNGYYALDATWESDGKVGGTKFKEALRSTYEKFLMTTDKDRESMVSKGLNLESYNNFFTSKTPDDLRIDIKNSRNNFYDMMRVLDPNFYKSMIGMNLSKDEDASKVISHFQEKVNNRVPAEKLAEAIVSVKKTIYKNLTEQDFENMKKDYTFSINFANMDYDLYAENGSNSQVQKLGGETQEEQNNTEEKIAIQNKLDNQRKMIKEEKDETNLNR